MDNIRGTALLLTNGWMDTIHAKTTHGILRGSDRFIPVAVIDPKYAGQNTETVSGIAPPRPIFATVAEALEKLPEKPQYCVVGVATHGGILPDSLRNEVIVALQHGISAISGLHSFISDDPVLVSLAEENDCILFDVRKPRDRSELRFWDGQIYAVKTPRIAILGTDCALGKRTTCKLLTYALRRHNVKAEMIYTGQTGWMEGHPYGFIFDTTINDFISGEIERAILACENGAHPDVMLIEGQSSLRNPSGPCGAEFLVSGNAKGVILQHAPGRKCFEGYEDLDAVIPPIEQEMELIRFYRSEVIAITLNNEGMTDAELTAYQHQTQERLGIPVVQPLKDGLDGLVPVVQDYIRKQNG
ncbi:MAG TPA: DUF1611 domain-containing protein [Calditrichia bacterium]|nr:DUF1611 domain-containing protein [Calditrichota bacterium]HQV32197.1 DUF1611 domain-containing protein [Calditrichia bacterium]